MMLFGIIGADDIQSIIEGENMVDRKMVEDLDFISQFQNLQQSVDTLMNDLIERKQSDSVLPNPTLYSYYKNLNNRVIWLNDEIYRESIVPLVKNIIFWNKKDEDNRVPVTERKPIKIMINSYGGEIDATFQMIDIIKLSKTPIYTYNMGVAMSGGFFILISGHKRFALAASQSLCHQGSGAFEGEAETIKSHTAQYNKTLSKLFDHVASCTKISKDLLNKKKKTEWFINGEEQVQLGVVDKIIDDFTDLL